MRRDVFMDGKQFYMSLPHDISGSRSKNRFRIELLWGISKILDLFDNEDFTVVFDYACDIEVHVTNGFEFYQIKTQTGNQSFTERKLTNIDGEGSILGKLYVLNSRDPSINTKLAIVSNSPFSDGRVIKNDAELCFNALSQTTKQNLETALKNELAISSVDLSNVFFIHTDFNFSDPQNEIIGKLCVSFEKIKNCEPSNPNALYRLIYETVSDKACYEFTSEEYDEIVSNKGFTKAEFENILDIHTNNAKTGIKQTEEYIENLSNVQTKRKYKKALPIIMRGLCTSILLKTLERKIGEFLVSNCGDLEDIDSIIDSLTQTFHDNFPKEINNAEKIVFYIVVINRYIEGVYDL